MCEPLTRHNVTIILVFITIHFNFNIIKGLFCVFTVFIMLEGRRRTKKSFVFSFVCTVLICCPGFWLNVILRF